jgi:SAM-dependent methyltransferase
MSESVDLLDQKSHFAFGKNWASYAKLVTVAQVEEATVSLRRLAGGNFEGKRFLDIGCGSGLHALAALRLGASEVVALDIDSDSVATTRQLLEANASGQPWSVMEGSVFQLQPNSMGLFDVVYSWGVLHHTGDMFRALRVAAALVTPDGQLLFALYRRTRLCWFWKLEKRWYASARPAAQARARSVYVALFRLAMRGAFDSYVANYRQSRGMDFYHDVHDWLGGWPYESISPAQTERFMQELGMRQIRAFVHAGKATGLFGSGCDEYVYGPK